MSSTNGPTTVDSTTKSKFVLVFCLFDTLNIINCLFQCQQQLSQALLILPLQVSSLLYFVCLSCLSSTVFLQHLRQLTPPLLILPLKVSFFHAFCLFDMFSINNCLFQCQQHLDRPLLILPLKVSLLLSCVCLTWLTSIVFYFSVNNNSPDHC